MVLVSFRCYIFFFFLFLLLFQFQFLFVVTTVRRSIQTSDRCFSFFSLLLRLLLVLFMVLLKFQFLFVVTFAIPIMHVKNVEFQFLFVVTTQIKKNVLLVYLVLVSFRCYSFPALCLLYSILCFSFFSLLRYIFPYQGQ